MHKEIANRNRKSAEGKGRKRLTEKSFLPDEFSGTIASDWSEFLNQTTDGYYFYVLLFWYNAVIFMPVHHFDFHFYGRFYLFAHSLAGFLARLLLFFFSHFKFVMNAIISFRFANLYARFAACTTSHCMQKDHKT